SILSTLCPPPLSPLFPYTTLFRSDSSGQGLGALKALKAQPRRGIQASHPVMAITNYLIDVRQRVQACGQRAERHEFRALDAADFEFPWLAHVHEHHVLAAVQPGLHFGGSNLQLVHTILPSKPA